MPVKEVKKRAGNFYAQAIQYGATEEEFMKFFEEVMSIFVNAKKEHYYGVQNGKQSISKHDTNVRDIRS